MSGDNLSLRPQPATGDPPRDSSPTVTPELLRRARDGPRDATPEELMSSIVGDLLDDGDEFDVAEEVVTQSLDEILLALIALREDETHGTGLMEDMARIFDVQPSPGTVYPRLHDLEADGTLRRHDLVQTKQYSIDDESVADRLIERAMYQHIAVGLFLDAARDAV